MSTVPEYIASNLKTVISERLKVVPNFNEDVNQVAEYITLLMSNGSSGPDIVQELTSLFDGISTQEFQSVVSIAFTSADLLKAGDDLNTVYAKLSGNSSQPSSSAPSAPVSTGTETSVGVPVQSPPVSAPAPSAPVSAFSGVVAVSYTHLDVYKRQI